MEKRMKGGRNWGFLCLCVCSVAMLLVWAGLALW